MKSSPMILVSRDRRTASHFRSAWKSAAYKLTNVKPTEITRFETSIFFYFIKLILYRLHNEFILVFGVSEMLLLGWLKPSAGVVTGFGRLLSKRSSQRKIYFRLLRFMYRDKILFVLNTSDYRIFRKLGFNNVHKLNGEGFKRRFTMPSNRGADRTIPNAGKLRFLFIGRFLKSKGVETLIQMFLQLSTTSPNNLELYLVGDTDFANSDSIDKKYFDGDFLKQHTNIKFFPYTNSLSQFINSSCIYVSLSDREGMPFSVLEMLDAGIPCVLSNVAGHKDLSEIKNVILLNSGENLANLDINKLQSCTRLRDEKLDKYSHVNVTFDIVSILKNEAFK